MKYLKLLSSITLSTILLTACGSKESVQEKTTSEEVSTSKVVSTNKEKTPIFDTTYSVAVIDNIEPYTYRGENREFTGFHVDIINAVAKAEKFNVDYIEQPWDGNFGFIQNDKVDFLAMALTINPERQKIVDFSNPVLDSRVALVVEDSLKDKSFDEITTNPENMYAILEGSSFIKYALSMGINKEHINKVSSQFLGVESVLTGKVNAAFGDSYSLKYYKHDYPDMNIVNDTELAGEYAYIVQNGDVKMQKVLNDGLVKIKANGEFDTIFEKWFGE